MGTQLLAKPLTWLVAAIATGFLLLSALQLPSAQLGVPFLLLVLLAVNTGTGLTIKIPHTRGQVPLSDGLVFLAMLLFGGEAAVLMAGMAGLSVSLRLGKRAGAVLFNSAVTVISTFLSFLALRAWFGEPTALPGSHDSTALILAVCVMALLRTTIHHCFLLLNQAAEHQPFSPLSGINYVWELTTYCAVATAAGAAAKLVGMAGFYPSVAAATITSIAYFACSTYLKATAAPAGQVERTVGGGSGLPAMDEAEEVFRNAFDHAAIGMALVSAKGRWLEVNQSLCDILGYTAEELLASNFQQITYPEDLGPALAKIKQLLKGKILNYQIEKRYLHKQGHPVWVLWSVSRGARDADNDVMHLIFQIQDITDRKRAEERLLHDAFHDALTGLPNRALFLDHLKLTMARTQRRNGQIFAVLFLDLDRFKIINDSLGHMIGDQLLVGIARRLEKCLRLGDTVARVGGDEFTIILEDIDDETEAIAIADRIQQDLSVPFNLSGREVFTTVSIGIAPSSTGYEHPEDILRDADTAMYRAKSQGKARHEVFDKAMHALAINLLQLETDMRRALERNEFFLQYQPIVSLDSFNLRGFEALVRWRHPERGLISPLDFIPVAEDTGQILAIGQWVLAEACQQMRRWQRRFSSEQPLFISVNLSSKQFTQPDLIDQIKQILEQSKLDPRSLKLEITESVVMENIDTATEMLKQLRTLGLQLSIDDFGTGYSSLSYLHRFPIDTLKIDRSFVIRMSENNENIEIVRTIIMLAQTLGMDVVAEGVETKDQLALLRRLGCENGQGYFFSRPLVVSGAEKILADTCTPLQPLAISNNVGESPEVINHRVKAIRPTMVA
ncbi:MAG TPA: EAL domain-containing protein [Pyrinomonadaceae bacterium]|jgi:diguanylate cyclase (GGDEF)-like protein/PAS domain S-box-containing protein